jgi:hypothetical protein
VVSRSIASQIDALGCQSQHCFFGVPANAKSHPCGCLADCGERGRKLFGELLGLARQAAGSSTSRTPCEACERQKEFYRLGQPCAAVGHTCGR